VAQEARAEWEQVQRGELDYALINGYSLRDYGWDLALIGERGKPEVRKLMGVNLK
jgi:hypothetical protein